MRLILLPVLFALLCLIDTFGQTKSITVPVNRSGDTSLHYKWQRGRIAQMQMRDPLVAKDSLLIRISCENWSVEIWSMDFRTFHGRQYFFTKQYLSSEKRWSEVLFKAQSVSKPNARAVYEVFRAKSIVSIPDGKDVRRWPWGYDGVSYLVEYSTPSDYSFKSYWEPSSARYEIAEGAVIDDFIREVESTLKLPVSFLAFLNKLPPGTYHTGGITAYNNTGKKRRARK